jgi:hypothetical protein
VPSITFRAQSSIPLPALHYGNNRIQGPFRARERDLGRSCSLVPAGRRNHPETRSRPPETYSRPHAHTGHHKPQLGRPDTIGPDTIGPDSPDSPDTISPDSTKKRAAQSGPFPRLCWLLKRRATCSGEPEPSLPPGPDAPRQARGYPATGPGERWACPRRYRVALTKP